MRGLRTLVALAIVIIPAVVLAPLTAAADPPVLHDAITAGVVGADDGFGTSTVFVPSNGYVTYVVRGDAALSGRPLDIWTRSRAGDWAKKTTRLFGPDGTVRYHVRINEWTAFQGRIPADATTAGANTHGRIATVSADGSTRVRVDCPDVTTEDPGTVLVTRAVGAPVGSVVRLTLCSNASTGFGWTPSVLSSGQLATAGHSATAGPAIPGAAGTETWSFRVTGRGTGYAVLEYSRPWAGGEKAVWLVVLRVN